MPYLDYNDPNDPKKQQQGTGQPQSVSGGGGSFAGGAGGTGQGGATAGSGTGGNSQFTNIQAYLQPNQGASQGSQQYLQNTANAIDQSKQQLGQGYSQWQQGAQGNFNNQLQGTHIGDNAKLANMTYQGQNFNYQTPDTVSKGQNLADLLQVQGPGSLGAYYNQAYPSLSGSGRALQTQIDLGNSQGIESARQNVLNSMAGYRGAANDYQNQAANQNNAWNKQFQDSIQNQIKTNESLTQKIPSVGDYVKPKIEGQTPAQAAAQAPVQVTSAPQAFYSQYKRGGGIRMG